MTIVTQHLPNKPFAVFTIDVLSNDEIQNLRDFVDTQLHNSVRNFTNSDFLNGRLVEPTISERIYNKILPFLPEIYTDFKDKHWEFVRISKTVMFANVEPGKHFGLHTDTGCEFDLRDNTCSKYTVLVYLNDDFMGGSTTFYSDDFDKLFAITPRVGRILCFDIDMFHKGEVVSGGSKVWIGSELVCRCVSSSIVS